MLRVALPELSVSEFTLALVVLPMDTVYALPVTPIVALEVAVGAPPVQAEAVVQAPLAAFFQLTLVTAGLTVMSAPPAPSLLTAKVSPSVGLARAKLYVFTPPIETTRLEPDSAAVMPVLLTPLRSMMSPVTKPPIVLAKAVGSLRTSVASLPDVKLIVWPSAAVPAMESVDALPSVIEPPPVKAVLAPMPR